MASSLPRPVAAETFSNASASAAGSAWGPSGKRSDNVIGGAFRLAALRLMLMDLKAPLKMGDKVPATLTFEKAGKVDVTLDVQSIGAQQPSDMPMPSDDGGHMHKM